MSPQKHVINLGYQLCNIASPLINKSDQDEYGLTVLDPTSIVYFNVTSSCTQYEAIKIQLQKYLDCFNDEQTKRNHFSEYFLLSKENF